VALVEREEKIAAEVAARIEQASTLRLACRFTDAAAVLEAIPPHRRSGVNDGITWCNYAATRRSQAMKILSAATSSDYTRVAQAVKGYADLLAASGVDDAEFTQSLARAQAAYAEAEQRRWALRTAAIVASVVAILVILLVGISMFRSSQRAAAIASAIRSSRWDRVLALDPANILGDDEGTIANARGEKLDLPAGQWWWD
jgi:hypothetical protein